MAENSEQTAKRKRGRGRPFAKGVSGNPGGRRPVPDAVKEIFLAADENAARRIVELIDSEDGDLAFKASVRVVEQNHGKLKESVDLTSGGDVLSFQIVRRVGR